MKKVLLLISCMAFLFVMVNPGDFEYVGANKCKMCHRGDRKGNVFEKWQQGPHAKAFESLKQKGQEKNAKCLECHTTGFNKGGYKLGDANASNFEGVGCEACHGPGSAYKSTSIMKNRDQALKNGLVNVTEQTCTTCHDGSKCEHAKGFDFKKAMAIVDHTYQKN